MSYEKILALARLNRKNQTPAEAYFWEKVRNRKIKGKKFLRQFMIQHSRPNGKKRFFIADFYCHEKKLIVEIDGGIHDQQVEEDKQREEILKKMGYSILRFKNQEVMERWEVVEQQLLEVLFDSPPGPLSLQERGSSLGLEPIQ